MVETHPSLNVNHRRIPVTLRADLDNQRLRRTRRRLSIWCPPPGFLSKFLKSEFPSQEFCCRIRLTLQINLNNINETQAYDTLNQSITQYRCGILLYGYLRIKALYWCCPTFTSNYQYEWDFVPPIIKKC